MCAMDSPNILVFRKTADDLELIAEPTDEELDDQNLAFVMLEQAA